jgi:hypothetical protein
VKAGEGVRESTYESIDSLFESILKTLDKKDIEEAGEEAGGNLRRSGIGGPHIAFFVSLSKA